MGLSEWSVGSVAVAASEHVTTRNLTASINRVAMSVWPHEEEFIRAVLPYLGCNTEGAETRMKGASQHDVADVSVVADVRSCT